MDASDILENKVSQLQSLLSCCYGDGGEWFEVIGARHRDNIMWIASDLATEVGRLSQEMLKATLAMDESRSIAWRNPVGARDAAAKVNE